MKMQAFLRELILLEEIVGMDWFKSRSMKTKVRVIYRTSSTSIWCWNHHLIWTAGRFLDIQMISAQLEDFIQPATRNDEMSIYNYSDELMKSAWHCLNRFSVYSFLWKYWSEMLNRSFQQNLHRRFENITMRSEFKKCGLISCTNTADKS